jgi:hypothetical protein
MHGNIILAKNGIYVHHKKKKVGGGIKPTNDTIRRISSQVNNPSTGLVGLGSQSDVLTKSAFKPSGSNIIYGGGSISSQLSKINFNTNKKDRNVKLRL